MKDESEGKVVQFPAQREELDYGEGKTREQDAADSMAMLGIVLSVVTVVMLVLILVGVWWRL